MKAMIFGVYFLHASRGRQIKKYLLQTEKQVKKHCLFYNKIWSNYTRKEKQKGKNFHYTLGQYSSLKSKYFKLYWISPHFVVNLSSHWFYPWQTNCLHSYMESCRNEDRMIPYLLPSLMPFYKYSCSKDKWCN